MIINIYIMLLPISSVEIKCCKSTNIKVLKKIDLCINFQQIPLPPYRTTIQQDNVYCNKCFDLQNFDPKSYFKPHKEILNC